MVDRKTGTILLLSTHNLGIDHERADHRRDQPGHSNRLGPQEHATRVDRGAPRRRSRRDTKKPDWSWYATGPGAGIQIQHGPHKGRLVIPCDHIEAESKRYYSHVIYSDDGGKTWRLGGSTPEDQVNECEVVELADPPGRLMLNMRNYDPDNRTRQTALSDDGGLDLAQPDARPGADRADLPGLDTAAALARGRAGGRDSVLQPGLAEGRGSDDGASQPRRRPDLVRTASWSTKASRPTRASKPSTTRPPACSTRGRWATRATGESRFVRYDLDDLTGTE